MCRPKRNIQFVNIYQVNNYFKQQQSTLGVNSYWYFMVVYFWENVFFNNNDVFIKGCGVETESFFFIKEAVVKML